MASPSLSGGSLLVAALVVVGGAPWLARTGACALSLAAELTLLAYQQQLLRVLNAFSCPKVEALIRYI
jgi:nicotinamide mononucleotide (NMN) deamidase PncC